MLRKRNCFALKLKLMSFFYSHTVLKNHNENFSANRIVFNLDLCPVADLGGGGDGGDASPPTSLKVTILAEKSDSISNNSAPFRDASPPTDLNVTNPAKNHSQFW